MSQDDQEPLTQRDVPEYRSRISEKTLNQSQPEIHLDDATDEQPVIEQKSVVPAFRLGGWLILAAVLVMIAFGLTDAMLMIRALTDSTPWLSITLSAILFVFVLLLLAFVLREWRGYLSIKRFLSVSESLDALQRKDDKTASLAALKRRENLQSGSSFARHCYQEFHQALRSHHSNDEVLMIYRDRVVLPIQVTAKKQLNKVSMTSGGLAFLSPNSLIQSILFLWMGMRTLRLIAQVYGLRTGWAGNWRLLRLALEGLAVTSVVDLLSDEVVSQIGGGVGAKVLEGSTEAIAAGGLNYRLGRSLIRQLDQAFAE